MKPKWLIESNCFEEQQRIMEEVIRQGMECKEASYRPFQDEFNYLDLFDKNDCVIFYGSLGFAAQIQREASWIPGVYCNLKNLNCDMYYPAFGKHLLNEHYIMLPYGDLPRREEFLYDLMGLNRAIFLRPNSGNKTFTGQVIYKESFAKTLDLLAYTKIKPQEMCLVSQPCNLVKEWRFVIVDKQVVAGSLYKLNDKLTLIRTENGPVWDFAQNLAGLYEPDRAWVMDICETKEGSLHVLEIGCFSCAGLYDSNLENIVRSVSETALAEWEDINS